MHHSFGAVMISVLASSAQNHEFKPRPGQAKEYKIQKWYLLLLRCVRSIKGKGQILVGSEIA
jgi:hypothetical protein